MINDNRLLSAVERIEMLGKGGRDLKKLIYRTAKLAEEAGECNGALISVDNRSYKNLTYMDVLEEALDTWIVSVDIALSDFPEFSGKSREERNDIIFGIIDKKLNKWEKTISSKE